MASSWSAPAPVIAKKAANDHARRDKRRRNLLVLVGIVAAVGIGVAAVTFSHWNPRQTSGGTASGQTHVTPAAATQCLTARGALVRPRSARNVIGVFPTAPAVRVEFAAHPLNDVILWFEPSHATAQRAIEALAARGQGHVSGAQFNRTFQTKNNVVVAWLNSKIPSASRSAVLGCIS